MEDESVLEERTWTVREYLEGFDPDSPDTELVRQRAQKLASIVVRRVRDGSGRCFEDTEFVEISGARYRVRVAL